MALARRKNLCVSMDDPEAASLAEDAVSCLLDISEDAVLLQDATGATTFHTALLVGANERVLVRLLR